jgi:hypothetical protein
MVVSRCSITLRLWVSEDNKLSLYSRCSFILELLHSASRARFNQVVLDGESQREQ